MPQTMLDKIWALHVVPAGSGEAEDLIHIDGHLLIEGGCAPAFFGLAASGRTVRNPELTLATIDHVVSTSPGRGADSFAPGAAMIETMRRNAAREGITLLDIDDVRQGIVHVVAAEQGFVLPGMTVVCSDSHTATAGGLGALAWGIGTSEAEHVLATQMLRQRKPLAMRIRIDGKASPGIYPKDVIMHLVRRLGINGGKGFAVEYAGAYIRDLSAEGRMTICNMSIEMGAKIGFIAPDETTFAYLRDRPMAPAGEVWRLAEESWRSLPSDPGAVFDTEHAIDCSSLGPQITWGVTPEDVIAIDEPIPDPAQITDPFASEAIRHALEYQGLEPGRTMEGLGIDVAFIGSCTNSRFSDLASAAEVVRGRRVAPGVRALVVPGSGLVRARAEREGLADTFIAAGFEWREPGCSMCVSMNDDLVLPRQRCISSSNRNFRNRQGPGARTHLASPASVAAAAVTGHITDVRRLLAYRETTGVA